MRFLTGRPVLALVLFVSILLLGIYSLLNTPVELIPDERLPEVTVSGSWIGAAPDLVMQRLALPIEEEVMGIKGVAKIKTRCQEGSAEVRIEFARGTDMEFVTVLLKERINRLRAKLPPAVPLPTITPYRPREFETKPFMEISVYGVESIFSVRTQVDREFVPRLRSIDGIKNIDVVGGVEMAVKITPDNQKLKLLGLDLSTIIGRIRQTFFNMISATTFVGGKEVLLSLTHPAVSAAEIGETVIGRRGERAVLLKDVASVDMGYKEITSEGRYQGLPTINLMLLKQPRASTIGLAAAVKSRLDEAVHRSRIKLRYNVTYDESKDLKERLYGLIKIALLILGVIFGILLVFVRDIKAALLIFSSVFFSVFATFTVIYLFDIPLNLLTLSGFALGFGMFVDNAVVVFDNILRLQEKGMNRSEASILGPRQVIVPILASTLTTIVVFFSFAYFQGRLRVYYLPVAITVSVALAASIAVSFTLIPPLAARMHFRFKPMRTTGVGSWYFPILRYPLFSLLPIAALFLFSLFTFQKEVSFGQFFSFYQKQTLNVVLRLPPGSEFEDSKEAILNFEKLAVEKRYEKEVTTSINGPIAYMRVSFPKEIEFSPYPYELKRELIAQAANLAGVGVSVWGFDPEGYYYSGETGSYLPYSIQIRGYDFDRLLRLSEDLKRGLLLHRKIKEVAITTDNYFFRAGSKYFHMSLDYEKLAKLNLNPAFLLYMIRSNLRTDQRDRIRLGEKEYDVDIRLRGADNIEMDELMQKEFQTLAGVPFRLRDVLRIEEREAKGGISRENQEYIAIVSWDYMGSNKSADRVYKAVYNNLQLPPGFKKSEEERRWLIQEEEQKQLEEAIILALFLIMLILVVLYDIEWRFFLSMLVIAVPFAAAVVILGVKIFGLSTGMAFLIGITMLFSVANWQAFLIMLAIPLSLIGVFLGFAISGFSWDSTAYVGLILLFGLVVNNAIIMVEHINLYVRRGQPLRQAIAQGAYERIRPIFMTTATTVLGALPMVIFKQGEQADIWSTLALCTVGGLTTSSVLILVVIPIFFDLFWRLKMYVMERLESLGVRGKSAAADSPAGAGTGEK